MSWSGFGLNFKSRDSTKVNFLNSSDAPLGASTLFPHVRKGFVSDTIEIHLWNNGTLPITSAKILLSPDFETVEIERGKWIEVKSDGVVNPDNVPMTDDAFPNFIPVGGSDELFGYTYNDAGFTGDDDSVSIGDIPANCARKLFFRVNVPDAPIAGRRVNPDGSITFGVDIGVLLFEPQIFVAYLTDEFPGSFNITYAGAVTPATPVNGQVLLAWTSIAGASSYNVYRYKNGVGNPFELIANVSTLNFLDVNVVNSQLYRYAVISADANGIEGLAVTSLTATI